jgi:hypothetical protein
VGQHEHANDFHAHALGQFDVLLCNVGFSDVRGNLRHLGSEIASHLEIVLRANARQQQHGQLSSFDHRRGGLE